jgi:hypothetical protein
VYIASHPCRSPHVGFVGEVPTRSESDSSLGVAPIPHPRFPKSFPCHTSENSPVSPAIATDPKTPFSKSCVCYTSEPPWVITPNVSTFKRSTLPTAFYLSPFLSDSCALFCTCQNLNSFAFKRLRTLCQKPPGVGGYPSVSSPQLVTHLAPREEKCSERSNVQTFKRFFRDEAPCQLTIY